jgi:electron transfer flavoprotein alpha subunit
MNGVLVILEHRGAWSRLSWEALAAGQEAAEQLKQPLLAAVAAGPVDDLAADLRVRKVQRAWLVQHELLSRYTSEGYVLSLNQLIRKLDPAFIVFPHTYQVRDFAPRLAAQFDQMLISDVIAMRFEDGRPIWVRQLLQGKLNADYRHSGEGPCFVSVQAGAFRADSLSPGAAEIEVFTPELQASQICSKPEAPFRVSEHTVDLASAPLIVSVGRGIKEKENIPIVAELAQALGAELGASRPICDNGWLPMERQVGSSGQTVSPKLYLAVGISGAIQHLVGMKGSKTIVAINKDENAPIFEVADYGIVGDLFEVVPALTAAVRKVKRD